MYKCCIFDLDGTLVNSIYAIQRAVNLTLDTWGMGPVDVEQTKAFVGDGYRTLLERALTACKDVRLEHFQEADRRYVDIFKECYMYRMEAYEGIADMLAFLRKEGIHMAVLSNKPHDRTVENVEAVFGAGCFERIYGEREDKGIEKKPSPDGVWSIMKEFGVEREEVLYFGDTNTDMRTGKNAGVDTVGVTWGFRGREELEAFAPRLIADHPAQVVEFIKEVNGIEY
ncbi:MAG: HAD family hydrolase [Clostridium sp.]|nr:HAD family hydrolase [Clostridium sp.]